MREAVIGTRQWIVPLYDLFFGDVVQAAKNNIFLLMLKCGHRDENNVIFSSQYVPTQNNSVKNYIILCSFCIGRPKL